MRGVGRDKAFWGVSGMRRVEGMCLKMGIGGFGSIRSILFRTGF